MNLGRIQKYINRDIPIEEIAEKEGMTELQVIAMIAESDADLSNYTNGLQAIYGFEALVAARESMLTSLYTTGVEV